MSTNIAVKSANAAPASNAAKGREPQQGRSKASLGRMLSAARDLMLERGSEEFTLQEVSQRGNVSIGSIYLRFESKDNLVRAVIAEADTEIGEAEHAMFAKLKAECRTLGDFVPKFVDAYAEVLRTQAPILRLSMQRAVFDSEVAGPGKARAAAAEAATCSAMLEFSDEIGGDDAERKTVAAHHVIFATLARQLSLGSSGEAAQYYDWDLLKYELGRMCLAYLRAD